MSALLVSSNGKKESGKLAISFGCPAFDSGAGPRAAGVFTGFPTGSCRVLHGHPPGIQCDVQNPLVHGLTPTRFSLLPAVWYGGRSTGRPSAPHAQNRQHRRVWLAFSYLAPGAYPAQGFSVVEVDQIPRLTLLAEVIATYSRRAVNVQARPTVLTG